jgi:hypothetical protein
MFFGPLLGRRCQYAASVAEGFAHQHMHIVPALAPPHIRAGGFEKESDLLSGWPEHD